MQRYDSYKDSGVQWLGEIPSHWEVNKFKNLYNTRTGITFTKAQLEESGEPVISYGQIHSKENKYSSVNPVLIRHIPSTLTEGSSGALAVNGDFLFADTSEDFEGCGNCVYVDTDYPIYAGYHTILAKKNNIECGQYFAYLFACQSWRGQVRSMVNGVKVYSITQTILKNTTIILPPISEQQAIASYLDEATSKIDAAIAQQQKMIDLLNERKQIIINNAVTKGLNPNVKMKDSGVDWIGEIPEHWEVIKLKYIFRRIADGTHFSPETIEEGMPYITATDVRGKGIDFNETKKISQKDYEALVAAGCKPQLNDILLVKDGATTGRVGLMIDDTDCVTLSSVAMLSPQKKYSHLYLMYMMMSDFMQKQILLSMAGAAMPRITLIKLSNFIGIVPPMDEQESIATYIEKASMPIDSAIKSAEKQISLLQERKQIIINDVVTGKVKVV